MKKIYIILEHYTNAYSHPLLATDNEELAYEIMRIRNNPDTDTTWVEAVNYYEVN